MTQDTAIRDLFDRRRRALRRDRILNGGDYLGSSMADQLVERLDDVRRTFTDVLVVGGRVPALADAMRGRGAAVTVVEPATATAATAGAITADEDRMPVEPDRYDLVLWPGGLEGVNDVPGALLRARLALKPDGLLLGCFIGDGSLPQLRAALASAEVDRPAARMHPQVGLAALGDLLHKVGCALPVVDVERLALSYAALPVLIADLRAAALTSVLAGPVPPLSRTSWLHACAAFADAGDGGRTVETLRIVHFSGWAPHPDQPKPARRGSATASLAAALRSSEAGEASGEPGG